MSKLLKYEFKKSKNVTLAILLVTVIGEALFVTGTIAGAIPLTSSGVLILALAATFGIFIMAVLSIDILHRELNTNQSYMLFLTPRNSYQILGSKILANAISLSLMTVLFAVLAALDLLLIGIREVGMPVPADGIRRALGSTYLYMPTGVGKTIATAAIAYGSWLFLIVTAYFADILQATVLRGRKGAGWISFLLFLVLAGAVVFLQNKLAPLAPPVAETAVRSCVYAVFIVVFFCLGGWIMDHRLSV
ncbi:MAG: hypothetical protein MR607_08510 [Lachnospiraceae bacterium]|nr:hypothetical protein [Lachnospiraceae bacterium]